MQRENVQALLANYRANQARAAHIEVRLSEIEPLITELKAHAGYYLTSTTQAYTEGTGGGKVESKVEKLACAIADGKYPGEIGNMIRERDELADELRARKNAVRYVDCWVMALNARERFVITEHLLNGRTWRETGEMFAGAFGDMYSKAGLKGLMVRALECIYNVAT